jgi:hypothetical protein
MGLLNGYVIFAIIFLIGLNLFLFSAYDSFMIQTSQYETVDKYNNSIGGDDSDDISTVRVMKNGFSSVTTFLSVITFGGFGETDMPLGIRIFFTFFCQVIPLGVISFGFAEFVRGV